jgi:hypothetical protein
MASRVWVMVWWDWAIALILAQLAVGAADRAKNDRTHPIESRRKLRRSVEYMM